MTRCSTSSRKVKKNMPSYASQIPAADRRAAIAHVRELQGANKP